MAHLAPDPLAALEGQASAERDDPREKQLRIFRRYQPFWPDEWVSNDGKSVHRPPWWRPFNIFLHQWVAACPESLHDHPRWSITIFLRGRIIEHTPWLDRAPSRPTD